MKNRIIGIIFSSIFAIFISINIRDVCTEFQHIPGYGCRAIDDNIIVLLIIISIIPSIFIPINASSQSIMMWGVYLLYIISSTISPGFLFDNQFEAILYGITITSIYSIFSRINILTLFNNNTISYCMSINLKLISFIITFVSAILLLYVVIFLGMRFELPSIFHVYDTRLSFKSILNESPLLSYILIWLEYAFSIYNIILSVVYFSQKRRLMAIVHFFIAISITLYVYSIAAYKSAVFLPLYAITLMYIVMIYKRTFPEIIYMFLNIVIIILSYAVYVFDIFNNAWLHWIRRTFSTPGYITAYYYILFIKEGIVGDENYPLIVAQEVFQTNGSANTGFIGASFVGGELSLAPIYFLIFFAYIQLLTVFTRHIPNYISIGTYIPLIYVFSNSSPFTVLITYGGVMTLMFLFMLNCYFGKNFNKM